MPMFLFGEEEKKKIKYILFFDLTVPLGPGLLILPRRQIFKILFGVSPC